MVYKHDALKTAYCAARTAQHTPRLMSTAIRGEQLLGND